MWKTEKCISGKDLQKRAGKQHPGQGPSGESSQNCSRGGLGTPDSPQWASPFPEHTAHTHLPAHIHLSPTHTA